MVLNIKKRRRRKAYFLTSYFLPLIFHSQTYHKEHKGTLAPGLFLLVRILWACAFVAVHHILLIYLPYCSFSFEMYLLWHSKWSSCARNSLVMLIPFKPHWELFTAQLYRWGWWCSIPSSMSFLWFWDWFFFSAYPFGRDALLWPKKSGMMALNFKILCLADVIDNDLTCFTLLLYFVSFSYFPWLIW